MINKALIQLSDLAICASNDFHCLHLNIVGADFDTMHKKVLKKYYEEAADDYDSLAEFARMYEEVVPNACLAAERIAYKCCELDKSCDRSYAIQRVNEVLEELTSAYTTLFIAANKDNCPKAIGIANWLAGRLEYWSKELWFFNKSRS